MDNRHLRVILPSRRQLVTALGLFGAGAGLILPACGATQDTGDEDDRGNRPSRPQQPESGADLDAKIFTFALNLEYMEAEYYSRGASGRGLEEQGVDVGENKSHSPSRHSRITPMSLRSTKPRM
jgi:hypothetical protein